MIMFKHIAFTLALMLTIALVGCEKQPPAPPQTPDNPPTTTPPAPEVQAEPMTEAPAPAEPAAPTGEDVKREVGEALTVTGQYTAAKTKEFVEAAKVKLAEMDQQIDELAVKAKDKSKSTWESMKLQYEQKKAAAAAKLAELKEAGGESWENAKHKANEALDEAQKSYEAVKKKLLEEDTETEQPITTEQ